MLRAFIIVAVALLGMVSAGPISQAVQTAEKNQTGYVTMATFWCDTFLCPSWELDITRYDVSFNLQDSQKLSILIGKTPIEEMNFQVLTSYDQIGRTYYVAGAQHPGGSTLWVATVDGNVSKATPVGSARVFAYPNVADKLVRMHFISGNTNGQLLTAYASGNVYVLDTVTLKSTPLGGNLLQTTPKLNGGLVTQSSDVDVANGLFYTLATTTIVHNKSTCYLITMNVVSGVTTAQLLTIRGEDWAGVQFFNGVFIPDQNALVVFAQAGGPTGIVGFDQILNVFPDGKAAYIYNNIQTAGNYAFQTYPATKQDDTLQPACYDPVTRHLYFQVTSFETDDDSDPMLNMAYLDYSKGKKVPYIDIAISPFAFEYMGWHFIQVEN